MSAEASHNLGSMSGRSGRLRCTGAILAGGASTRMGESKQDMLLADGRPMIASVSGTLAKVCERVVVLGESRHLRELVRIADLREGCGPLGGIEALLASGLDQHYLIVPCDLPLVTADVLEALLVETAHAATTFADRPLPARVSADALPAVRRLLDAGEQAVWKLMDEVDAHRVALPERWAAHLENVNSPEDAARITR